MAYRTYAPVGSHRDLLAYLVRRLLENGANSSFVALAADHAVPVATLLRRPAEIIGAAGNARHPNIPLPRDLYQPQRVNSRGIEFGERAALNESGRGSVAASQRRRRIGGDRPTPDRGRHAERSCVRLPPRAGFKVWSRTPAETRAKILEKAADLLERRRGAFHRAAAARGRQDARRRAVGSPRGRRFLPLLRRAGPQAVRRRRSHAGPDRREQCAAAARPRRVRRDIAVEFSAGDFSRPGRGGADGRQCGGGKTRRTDAADRGRSGSAAA